MLEVDDIQGNILGAFNKDFQQLVALTIRDVTAAKAWLSRVAPVISSVAEVAQFNQLFRARRKRMGHDPLGLIATWVNIAFSHDGLAKLTSQADADGVPDIAFRAGLPDRAASLGDMPAGEGQPVSANWVVGGAGHVPDILLIVASDDVTQLDRAITQLCPGAGDLAALRTWCGMSSAGPAATYQVTSISASKTVSPNPACVAWSRAHRTST